MSAHLDAALAVMDAALADLHPEPLKSVSAPHACHFYCCPACHTHMLSPEHMAKGSCT